MRKNAVIPTTPAATKGEQTAKMTAQKGGNSAATTEAPAVVEATTEAPAAPATEAQEVPSAAAPAVVAPTEVQALTTEAPAEQPAAPSLTELLARAKRVISLQEKFNKLQEMSASVAAFQFGANGYTDTLEIKDGYGRPFQTTKSALIKRVMEMIVVDTNACLAETEAEIRAVLNA